MTATRTRQPLPDTSRLTPRVAVLMFVAALAIFGAAYGVAGLFGRAANDTVSADVVAAVTPFGTPDVTLQTKNVAFNTQTITVKAGQPLHLRIENEDAGILHNIAVYADDAATVLVQRGALFDGPDERDFRFAPFPAGTYRFQCDLHPTMNGTFVVQ